MLTKTIGHWVQVYHMCYCSHVPEVHVVHHGDPELHGVGGHHVEVEHLDEVGLSVHQLSLHQHGLHQHHWVQGQLGVSHGLLQPWASAAMG